jgi:hypothetical protein
VNQGLPTMEEIRSHSSEPTEFSTIKRNHTILTLVFQWLILSVELRQYGVHLRASQQIAETRGSLLDLKPPEPVAKIQPSLAAPRKSMELSIPQDPNEVVPETQ